MQRPHALLRREAACKSPILGELLRLSHEAVSHLVYASSFERLRRRRWWWERVPFGGVNWGFWRETFGVRVECEPVGLGKRVLARGNLGMWVAGGRGSMGVAVVVVVHRHWGISEKLYQ